MGSRLRERPISRGYRGCCTNSFLVLASAHTADPNAWAGLRDTCDLFGVPLRVLGTDNPLGYASDDPRLFLEGVPEVIEALRVDAAEYVLITDAFDVLACRRWDAGQIAGYIDAAPGKLLMSCEANCFPDGPWRAAYDRQSGSPWRYANAGQLCGTREAVITLLTVLQNQVATLGRNAQETIHRLYANRDCEIGLDTDCRVFQSLFTGAAEHVSRISPMNLRDACAFNRITGAYPFFLHANGRAPGYPGWYRYLTGRSLPPSLVWPEYGE
jgi:hypothetical protein